MQASDSQESWAGVSGNPEDETAMRLPPKQEEPSFDHTFAKFWNNEAYHDLTLECTDGVKIGVNRFALAARNTVFETMLLGQFREASSATAKVNYKGDVTKIIVEYIHTGKAEILDPKLYSNDTVGHSASNQLEILASLIGAGVFYDMPNMCHQAVDCIDIILTKEPDLALTALEAYCGPTFPQDVKEIVLARFWTSSFDLADGNQVGQLSPSALEELLKDVQTPLNDYELFQMLLLWSRSAGGNGVDSKEISKDMVQHIYLERICPSKLTTIVAPSGIVARNQVYEAYKHQALSFEKRNALEGDAVYFEMPRQNFFGGYAIVWKSSATKDFEFSDGSKWKMDIFNSMPIRHGKYQWKLHVKQQNCSCNLGIVLSSEHRRIDNACGFDEESWAYHTSGRAYHNKTEHSSSLPQVRFGSMVEFTLDLVDKENGGTLTASVDGGTAFNVFDNLMKRLRHDRKGFVPAASICGTSSIRLMGCKKLV